MARITITNNRRVTLPVTRQPTWPLLSGGAVSTFYTNEVAPRLAQMGVAAGATDNVKMRAICKGMAIFWAQHPAAYPGLRFRAGGDSTFIPDDQDPIAMWAFLKAGGARAATVNDGGTSATGSYAFTGLKGDFTGPVDSAKPPTECTQQHLLMKAFAAACGIQSRLLNIALPAGGHVPFEYWDRQLQKWVIVDATYGLLSVRLGAGGPLLGWADVHRLALTGRKSEIVLEYITGVTGYNPTPNPDLVFNPDMAKAIAVVWYGSGVGVGVSVGLPKDATVVLIRSGDFANLQGSNWPESPSLRELDISMYALQVTRADAVTGGVSVTLHSYVPNFARYEWSTNGTVWTALPGNTATVPNGAMLRAIDDLSQPSNIVTVRYS